MPWKLKKESHSVEGVAFRAMTLSNHALSLSLSLGTNTRWPIACQKSVKILIRKINILFKKNSGNGKPFLSL